MKNLYLTLFTTFILFNEIIFAHCQVPCGIYEDAIRVYEIREDFQTIKKAMFNIKDLVKGENALSLNQASRWVSTKETHATQIQDRISHYFLVQRIKPKTGNEYDLYVKQTTLLHQIMIAAMKCKQTVDTKNVSDALKLLDEFIDCYFDDHGKDHINKIDH
ncbi:MAG: superoxide dismutase [Gammaproteobacteria bacterium]|nr:superoxide dismutase [Gammaproteobacteria bacterium]|tara:strand:- start:169 stop:651 length:483 start_codon:yes stop_codon:yes gene_type:complete